MLESPRTTSENGRITTLLCPYELSRDPKHVRLSSGLGEHFGVLWQQTTAHLSEPAAGGPRKGLECKPKTPDISAESQNA